MKVFGVYKNVLGVDEPHVGEFGSHVYMEITLKAMPIEVPDFSALSPPDKKDGCRTQTSRGNLHCGKVHGRTRRDAVTSRPLRLAYRLISTSTCPEKLQCRNMATHDQRKMTECPLLQSQRGTV